jgi:hypothetical protein
MMKQLWSELLSQHLPGMIKDKTGKIALHNVVYKIISGTVWSL